MSETVRRFLLRLTGDPGLDRRVRHTRLAALVTRFQTCHTVFFEPLLPAQDGGRRGLQRGHDLAVAPALRQGQDQTRAEHISRRERARLRPTRQLDSLFFGE